MNILVLGGDGYLGWPTALLPVPTGPRRVGIVDNFARGGYDFEMGVDTLVPIASLQRRVRLLAGDLGQHHRPVRRRPDRRRVRQRDPGRQFEPDAVVHFAEQRSAPYSMIDRAARRLHAGQQRGRHPQPALRHRRAAIRTSTWSSWGRWVSTARPTSTSKRASSRSPTRAAPTCCPTRSSPGSFYHLSKVHDSAQHHVRLPDLGHPGHRPQPGHRLRPRDRGDRPAPRPGHPVRLRRRVRNGAQPVLRPGRHRPPADRLRIRRPDPGHAQHPATPWPAWSWPCEHPADAR